ncbi:signal transduction histidine kinase/CheY-like chemotaxis protein [Caulobacter sp. BE264]|uniref:ATP-binding protein n=1 Tax=Caulobacter sp. BE264 TaxID=2817724 RepID=UPI0028657D16|nr:ATP-binding protein [Caulobacter sp. BE264]MDR7231126.1 signal transduction histidine kinase/CheY-like chemotaxis protein [Caulobacter sp. BE264]
MTTGANADSSPSGKRRLETQIVGVALLSTIVALLAAFSVYQWRNWRVDREALAQETLVLADALARSAHAHVAREEVAAVDTIRELIAASDRKIAVTYAPAQGREIRFASQGATFGPPAVKPVTAPEFRYRGVQLEAFAPIRVDGEQVGAIAVLVDGQDLLVSRFVNIAIALLLSAAALAGAGLMARRLTRQALAPLSALVEAVDQAATSKDFSARVPVARRDELGLLTERFNRLLATLEAYDADRQTALHEATLAREAAENANRLKERFLANMSHELRTPLNGVLGMSQSLLREPMVPSQRERVELIVSSGSVLLMLLNEILDLSDLERGAIRLENKSFDLATTIGEACDAAVLMAEDKGVALQIEVDAEAEGRWMGDARRLHQILYHLVANALKFTAAGQVRVTASAKAGELILSVADTGMGIDAEALPRLFEAFTQVDDASTRAFGGAGIGLSVCHRLVGLMGGRLEVESQMGQGSLFTVILPMNRDRASERAISQDQMLRVLVAEDNEANQRVVRTVLNALGIDPVIVADGEAVVRAWRTGAWDLVLMDIQMPLKNGVDATLEIRRLEAERGLPATRIVALTANAMPHQIETYHAAGMDGVVQKPIMIADLQAALVGDRAA